MELKKLYSFETFKNIVGNITFFSDELFKIKTIDSTMSKRYLDNGKNNTFYYETKYI